MASPNLELIRALRVTAERLAGDTTYQWGHMGMCNCGHLARAITGLTPAEIHASALERDGDWEQQAKDYCPTSGRMIDHVLAAMFSLGLHREDVKNLEKLADGDVIHRLGRYPKRNRRDDVVDYMRTWADILEEKITVDVLLVC
ncbi:MAG TPA: hypothetical protein VGK04_01895 [Thermoanaerobaculia bacterium]|jgi:hypothetical protein